MNRINRKIEYALMALKYMSGKFSGQLTTVKEICDATGSPFDATARVMQIMAQQGLLKSEHGAHGGYIIVQNLAKVSFYDLLVMILGPLGVVRCLHNHEGCELMGQCNIQSPLGVLNAKMGEFYSRLSLQELLQPKEPKAEAVAQPSHRGVAR